VSRACLVRWLDGMLGRALLSPRREYVPRLRTNGRGSRCGWGCGGRGCVSWWYRICPWFGGFGAPLHRLLRRGFVDTRNSRGEGVGSCGARGRVARWGLGNCDGVSIEKGEMEQPRDFGRPLACARQARCRFGAGLARCRLPSGPSRRSTGPHCRTCVGPITQPKQRERRACSSVAPGNAGCHLGNRRTPGGRQIRTSLLGLPVFDPKTRHRAMGWRGLLARPLVRSGPGSRKL